MTEGRALQATRPITKHQGLTGLLAHALVLAILATLVSTAACVMLFRGAYYTRTQDPGIQIGSGIGWYSRCSGTRLAPPFIQDDIFGWPFPCFFSRWQRGPNDWVFRWDVRLDHAIRLHSSDWAQQLSIPLKPEWRPLFADMAIWFAGWLTLTAGTVALSDVIVFRWRGRQRCRYCGYSGHRATGNICTECGADTTIRKPISGRVRAALRLLVVLHALALCIMATVLVSHREKPPALFQAIREGRLEAAQALFAALGDPNATFDERDAYNEGAGQITPLMYAAYWNNVQFLEYALSSGADIDQPDGAQRTGLHLAALAGSQKTMRLLIDRGADVNAPSRFGTPLLYAARTANLATVQMLLQAGADADPPGTPAFSVLTYISGTSRDGALVAKALIEAGAPVNPVNVYATPLMAACQNPDGGSEWIKVLLDAGADVNLRSSYGGTALMAAAEAGNGQAVRTLLDHGADVEIIDQRNFSPLYYAIFSHAQDAVRALLNAGADPNQPIFQGGNGLLPGMTSLHVAAYQEQYEIMKLLIAHGADLNAVDEAGQTPLIFAARMNRLESISILRQAGADESIVDAAGRTWKDYGR